MRDKTYLRWSIALIIIGAFLRFPLAVFHNVSGDACWHVASARYMAIHNVIPTFEGLGRVDPFYSPPVFHLIAALFFKIFSIISNNAADIGIKLVSPVFGTLTIIVAYLLIKKLFGERIAFYSMIFLNFAPLFIDYSVFSYVDSTNAFFSVLTVYLLINRRYALSSISFGINMLTKYNAIFMFPMMLYLGYKLGRNKKEKIRILLLIIIVPSLISSVWFLRNYAILGNPVWPFMNNVFHGINVGDSFNQLNPYVLLSYSTYLTTYLEFFGIPNGNIALLSFSTLPYTKQLLFIWLIGTLIFAYPLFKGIFFTSKKKYGYDYFFIGICILSISYILMLFPYVMNTGWFGSRQLLPIVPFIAILWSIGVDSIKSKKFYIIAVLVVCAGFVLAESIRLNIAVKEWNRYSKDFEWARENTKETDLFFGNGQCLPYNIKRLVVQHTVPIDFEKVDYVWANKQWRIDFPMIDEAFNKAKNSNKLKVVYDNKETGTIIYKVNK